MNGNTMQTKKKILLVDDDLILRDIYEAVLNEEGFEIITADDGQDAWDKLNQGLMPDAVFTGIVMPRMDGFALIEKIRQDPRFSQIPVAISSHKGLPEHEARAKELGVKDFIFQATTPPPQMVKRIKIVLGIKSNFRVSFLPNEHDGRALIAYLNKLQGTSCAPTKNEYAILELEAGPERNDFNVTLECDDKEG